MNEERIILDVDVRGEENIEQLSSNFRRLDQELENVNFDDLRRDIEDTNRAIENTTRVTTDSTRSMKTVRKEIKDLKDQLLNLEQGTEEYNRVLQEVANRTLELKDLNGAVAVSALDLGGKLENVVKVAGGIASAFSVAQAAQALFGDESKELQEVMVKLQAGIALVQGLQGLEGLTKSIPALVSSFKDFSRGVEATNVTLEATTTIAGTAATSQAAYGSTAAAAATQVRTETAQVVDNTREIIDNTRARLLNVESYARSTERVNESLQSMLSIQAEMNELNLEWEISESERTDRFTELANRYDEEQLRLNGRMRENRQIRDEMNGVVRESINIGEDEVTVTNADTTATTANTTANVTNEASTEGLSRSRRIYNATVAGTTPLTRAMTASTVAQTLAQNAMTVATNLGTIAVNGLKVAWKLFRTTLGPIALAFIAFEAVMWGVKKVMDWWNKDTKEAEKNAAKLKETMDKYNDTLKETVEFEKELNKLRGDTDLEALQKQYKSLGDELERLKTLYLSNTKLTRSEAIEIDNKMNAVTAYMKELDKLIDKETKREAVRKEVAKQKEEEERIRLALEEANKARAEALRIDKERAEQVERSKYLEPIKEPGVKEIDFTLDPEVLAAEGRNDLLARLDAQRTRQEQEEADKRAAAAEEENRFKEELVYNTADFLGNLGTVFEEHTVASKGLETASVAIEAAAGAAKCIAAAGATGPWGLAAGIAGAASITAAATSSIKRIWAVDAKNGTQDVNIDQPNIDNIIKPTIKPVQNVLTNSEIELQKQSSRVYVVESDIQAIGQRVKATESASTF